MNSMTTHEFYRKSIKFPFFFFFLKPLKASHGRLLFTLALHFLKFVQSSEDLTYGVKYGHITVVSQKPAFKTDIFWASHHSYFTCWRDCRYFLQDTLVAHGRWPTANGSCTAILSLNFRNVLDVLHLYSTDRMRQDFLCKWSRERHQPFTGNCFETYRVSLMWNMLGWRDTGSAGQLLKVGVHKYEGKSWSSREKGSFSRATYGSMFGILSLWTLRILEVAGDKSERGNVRKLKNTKMNTNLKQEEKHKHPSICFALTPSPQPWPPNP